VGLCGVGWSAGLKNLFSLVVSGLGRVVFWQNCIEHDELVLKILFGARLSWVGRAVGLRNSVEYYC